MRCANASQPPARDFVRVDDENSQIPVWPAGYRSQAGKAKFPSISTLHDFWGANHPLDFLKARFHIRVIEQDMPIPLRFGQPDLVAFPIQGGK